MKISHFPDFLPDETVFSVCSRYLDRMQFKSPSVVSDHFFGSHARGIATDFPAKLEYLVQVLPPYHTYTADMIIDQHTLFPLYAPFLPSERALTLRQRMKTGGASLSAVAGIIKSKVPRQQWLRYCPACVDHDRLTYGECYWHRIHQVPGVLVCPIHTIMLEDSQVNMLLGNTIAQYCSSERSVNNVSQRMIPVHLHAALVQLARNVQWLLEHPISIGQEYIQQQYFGYLTNLGLSTATGLRRYTELQEAILNYYPANLLVDLGCDIIASRSWLKTPTTMQHPLHHLLLIQFLCETAQDFFTKRQNIPTPFGYGPWPCLNPFCPHYKERIIRSYTIRQGRINHPIATFACSCGFAYSRTGPDRNDSDIFRVGRTIRYGNAWDQRLTTYWLDQSISTAQVARLMSSVVATVRKQAARLGLSFSLRRGKRPKIHQDYINERRALYRALWQDTLKAHPNATISKVIEASGRAHWWLKRHDSEWLKEHLPTAPSSLAANERLQLVNTQLLHKNYSLVDADLAESVRKIAEEVYVRPGFPIQITRQLLIAQIGKYSCLKRPILASKCLPLTEKMLSETIESDIDFIWRKLRWAAQGCFAEQVLPTYSTFLRRARIDYSTSIRPITKQCIHNAYNTLINGNILGNNIPEVCLSEVTKEGANKHRNNTIIAPGSLAAFCSSTQLIQPNVVLRTKPQTYNLIPILLLTVAAILNGAETCGAIASWGYQNEGLLQWFGISEGHFPSPVVFRKIYAKIDTNHFEELLQLWLNDTFPLIQDGPNKMKIDSGYIYVPGIWLLRPYRHIASEVVAKLR